MILKRVLAFIAIWGLLLVGVSIALFTHGDLIGVLPS